MKEFDVSINGRLHKQRADSALEVAERVVALGMVNIDGAFTVFADDGRRMYRAVLGPDGKLQAGLVFS